MKRKGSALLIVLGMMAFMIVSAVAFSAYMRSSRLPSSYLRRSSASRQLVKAAVAEAIDAVDRAVANNPHPGVGSQSVETDGRTRNIWPGRVLLATNRVDEVGKTVPVLTLEALAYIPPPLVNEVRYYSRLTSTATWHQFGFDSGRYAFCAVDVSDYLDVNRLAADRPRSSAPVRRISLSYLFESGREHTSSGTGAAEWDTFMERFRSLDDATLTFKYDSMVPLVSLADFNLALGEGGKGGFNSPFCSYVNTSGGDGFYNASSDDQLDKIRRMTFVTDSWLAGTDRISNDEESDYDDIYDLTDPQYQPFPAQLMGGPGGSSVATLGAIMGGTTQAKARLLDSIPVLSLVSLFDYLDYDKVPVSLACPTFERAPMICGLKPNLNGGSFALRLEPGSGDVLGNPNDKNSRLSVDDPSSGGGFRDAFAVYEYKIDPNEFGTALTKLTLSTLTVYPFPHDDAVDNTTFTVDGRAVFFLSQDDKPVTLRTGSDADRLHAATKNMTDGRGLSSANGTITVPFRARSKDFAPGGMEEQDAVFDDITLNTTMSPSDVSSEVFARIVYKWQQRYDAENSKWTNFSKPTDSSQFTIVEAQCGMPPLKSNGEPDPAFVGDAFVDTLNNGGKNVTLCMALMARIVDKNDKTVDLVPAHILDDKTFNNLNNSAAFPDVNKVSGSPYPVMLFPTAVKITFSDAGLNAATTAQNADFTPVTAVRIDDPRYNYAPESWYDADGDISKQTWWEENGSRNRDGDIFLATSDQGYMQSIYELAFLPRLSNLQNGGGIVGSEYKNPDDGRTAFGIQTKAMNSHIMWSSYRPFATKAGAADDFEGMGFSSSGSGFRVNPYSDSTNVLMAAFANTPVDWRMASTNNREVASIRTMKSSEFNKDYAWNEYSSETTFKWKDLEAVAGRFMECICPRNQRNSQSASYTEWKTAWRNLGWMYDPNNPESFCGVNLSGETADLWGVDRKFLYGYWRDCFSAKQQLFLVFVRAEPFMMGGQGVSQSPPQLGARAVALVWRDPAKSSYTDPSTGKTGYPHRTRVLFYRQFE